MTLVSLYALICVSVQNVRVCAAVIVEVPKPSNGNCHQQLFEGAIWHSDFVLYCMFHGFFLLFSRAHFSVNDICEEIFAKLGLYIRQWGTTLSRLALI